MGLVFTIGYGNQDLDNLVARLRRHGVTRVVDVRSVPVSKYMKAFDQDALGPSLGRAGLSYEFLGNLLGGKPRDEALWTDGKADYDKIRASTGYHTGLRLVREMVASGEVVALLCGCAKPMECHRGKLLAGSFQDSGNLEVHHIDMAGTPHPHNPEDVAVQLGLFS